ncbi:MAG: TonB-dependent receptor [Pseudomonadales bacterium]|nr:TonB-dependent receptor [Pseudomonadales bacterium]
MRVAISCFVLMGSLLVLDAPTVQAQPGETAVIEEIVVTARRREEGVQSVPIPVTAVSGDQLRERGALQIRDIERLTPNLDFQVAGSSRSSAQVFLRGIGQTNWSPPQDPKVGVYVDGVYLGRPQGSVFDLLDVERVEVLRGPQGTLFGRNTTAGLVHVINKRPHDAFEASVEGGIGNDQQYRLAAIVNVPLAETLAARVALQGRQADGYVRNAASGRDWNDEDRISGRATVLWTPADTLDVQFAVDAERQRERSALGQCVWGGPATGPESAATGGLPFIAYVFGVFDEIRDTCNATGRYRSTENDPDRSRVDAFGSALTVRWETGIGELTSITAYREVTQLNQSWGWGSDTVGTASYLEVLAYDDSEQDQWSQELRLAGNALDGRLAWVVGGYWFEEEASMPLVVPLFRGVPIPTPEQSPIFYAPTPPGFPAPTFGGLALATQLFGSRETDFISKNSSWAGFFEGTYDITEALSVTAGARYTKDERDFARTQTLLGGTPDPTLVCPDGGPPLDLQGRCEVSKSFDELTPRVILSYEISDAMMVYGGWSKGYSSGGFNQDVRMRPYEPEVSKNWEAGLKSTWLDRRLVFNLTAFHNTYENQQLTVGRLVEGQPTADLINAQEAALYGAEAEITFMPTPDWLFTGAFGWIDGEYDQFLVQDNLVDENFNPIIVTRDLSDADIIRGPPYTLSVSAAYTAALAGGHELVSQVGWYQRGRMYNTLETFSISKQEGYGLLDARITWRLPNGQTRVSLWGTNLLDKEYFQTAIDLSGGGLGTGTVTKYWAQPRRFMLEISHDLAR